MARRWEQHTDVLSRTPILVRGSYTITFYDFNPDVSRLTFHEGHRTEYWGWAPLKKSKRWADEHRARNRFDPSWRTEAVVALARTIRHNNEHHLGPVLADALDDAGCTNQFMLRDCRAGRYDRGRWVCQIILDEFEEE